MTPEERFEQNEKLIWHILHKKFGGSEGMRWAAKKQRCEVEDFYQSASIGLWRACQLYKEKEDTKFSSYASVAISNALIRHGYYYGGTIKFPQNMPYEERNKFNNKIINGDKPLDHSEGDASDTLFSIIDSGISIEEDITHGLAVKDILDYIKNNFSKRKVEIFMSYYFNEKGKKVRQIADELGATHQYYYFVLKEVRNSVRKRFEHAKEDILA